MAKRKTVDSFEIHVNYGQGFEHECTEFSLRDARSQRQAYRDNAPKYPVKIVPKRIKLEDLAPGELEGVLRDVADAKNRPWHKAAVT